MEFIDEEKINKVLKNPARPSQARLARILTKARGLKGLDIEDVATLIMVRNQQHLKMVYQTASYIKQKIYGRRIVLFAPLYLTNECINNCLYCGFRVDNKLLQRRSLTVNEAVQQARILEGFGHKRVLLVCGENQRRASAKQIAKFVRAIYSRSGMRIVHVNAAPFSVDEFRILKDSKIGVYQLFQETYHYQTYRRMHPSGIKSNYLWRLKAMDRAIESGIGDVGIGVLFGLYDWRFEILAIREHIRHLEKRFGFGPHTISVPRLRPAVGAVVKKAPYPVSNEELKRIIAILRLAVPYTGIVLTTRESPELRRQALSLGVSQISAGSRTSPGGYQVRELEVDKSQFSIDDLRTLDEVIGDVIKLGYLPSLCASCYRLGRSGKRFRQIADRARTKEFCQPNAILTLKEYLLDYSAETTRAEGEKLISAELKRIKGPAKRQQVHQRLKMIQQGKRDIYF